MLYNDEGITEEAIKALLILERVRDGLPKDNFPLKELWVDPTFAGKRAELREKFIRWAGEN